LVFAEAAATYMGTAIGRPAAHARLEELSQQAVQTGRHLRELALDAVRSDAALGTIDAEQLATRFDPEQAASCAQRLAQEQLTALRRALSSPT
jgi:3-carboxy-cis,cis-muconate cycloisomerase